MTQRLMLCAVGVLLVGCNNLTRVANPDVVLPIDVANAAGSVALRNSAIAAFATGFANQVLWSGLIADEFGDPTGFNYPSDARRVAPVTQSAGSTFPYDGLSQARLEVLTAIQNLTAYAPTPDARIGELYAAVAYAELFMVEDMCSGIPVGVLRQGVPAYGPTLGRSDLLRLSLAHFDSATAHDRGSDSVANLSRVGRARAFVDSGDFVNARLTADSVPVGFAYQMQYGSAAPPGNFIYAAIDQNAQVTVSNDEGENGLNFISAADPRVVTDSIGIGIYDVAKYSSLAAPMTVADGVEAALIGAESRLRAGDVAGWAAALNALRQTAISPAIDSLPSDSTVGASPAVQVAVQFRERAFWLFATGHRQGDLRRLVRQYGVPINNAFPSGPYHGGPTLYGTDVDYVPFDEQFNPNFHGCIARGP